MIIYTISPRRGKLREIANSPVGGKYNMIRYKDDLSVMHAAVGTILVKLTREDYEVIKSIFEPKHTDITVKDTP